MNPSSSVSIDIRHRQLGLSDDEVVSMYHWMSLARWFDERSLLLQRAGKINFHVSGVGQEAGQVGAAMALAKGTDYLFPYYRDYAFVLAMGMTLEELMLSIFAKADDPSSGGRQLPGHFGSKRLNIVTHSSPVTTQVPHAAGFALGCKMRGEKAVSFVVFGEGASNQGDFHEGCNMAGVHNLPVIFFCENNQYAISVPYEKQVGQARIADRALGYGFPGVRVDGNDPLAVYSAVKEAHERALAGEGPTLIEAMMYRLSPHTTADDDMLYRKAEEVEEHRKFDGIPLFKQYLMDHELWDETQDDRWKAEVKQMLDDAIKYADKAAYPVAEDLYRHVYAEQQSSGGTSS